MNKYNNMLLKSLIEDVDYWEMKTYGDYDYSWSEWVSKEYVSSDKTKITFCVSHLNFGTCAYIDRIVRYRFFYMPIFSDIAKAIRRMKKHVKNKNKKLTEDYLESVINKF